MIKRVGIDLDNTVADYMRGAIPLLKEHYGLEPDYSKTVWKIEEVFGLTSETRPPCMRKKLYEDLHLFKHLPMIEKDSNLLSWEIQRTLGAKVYFITARSSTDVIVKDTLFWLSANGFVYDDIFFTDEKHNLCRSMDINVMIEDEMGQLINLINHGIDVVIPDKPWNRHLPEDPRSIERKKGRAARVQNWRQAFRATEEFLQ